MLKVKICLVLSKISFGYFMTFNSENGGVGLDIFFLLYYSTTVPIHFARLHKRAMFLQRVEGLLMSFIPHVVLYPY